MAKKKLINKDTIKELVEWIVDSYQELSSSTLEKMGGFSESDEVILTDIENHYINADDNVDEEERIKDTVDVIRSDARIGNINLEESLLMDIYNKRSPKNIKFSTAMDNYFNKEQKKSKPKKNKLNMIIEETSESSNLSKLIPQDEEEDKTEETKEEETVEETKEVVSKDIPKKFEVEVNGKKLNVEDILKLAEERAESNDDVLKYIKDEHVEVYNQLSDLDIKKADKIIDDYTIMDKATSLMNTILDLDKDDRNKIAEKFLTVDRSLKDYSKFSELESELFKTDFLMIYNTKSSIDTILAYIDASEYFSNILTDELAVLIKKYRNDFEVVKVEIEELRPQLSKLETTKKKTTEDKKNIAELQAKIAEKEVVMYNALDNCKLAINNYLRFKYIDTVVENVNMILEKFKELDMKEIEYSKPTVMDLEAYEKEVKDKKKKKEEDVEVDEHGNKIPKGKYYPKEFDITPSEWSKLTFLEQLKLKGRAAKKGYYHLSNYEMNEY